MNLNHEKTFVKASIGEPMTLDPALPYETRSMEVIMNIYEPLFIYSLNEKQFIPRLAREIPTQENGLISEDGLTYRIPIRQGVKFHSGDELTVEDVVYSLRRLLLSERNEGPAWMVLEPILGRPTLRDEKGRLADLRELLNKIQADGNSVVIRLAFPFSPFLSTLSGTWASIICKRWACEHGEWPGTVETAENYIGRSREESFLTEHANGTGPFRLSRWEKGKEIELERFDAYWRGPAFLQRAIIKRSNDWEERRRLLLSGEADMVQTDRTDVPELEKYDTVKIVDSLPMLVSDAISFNFDIDTKDNPYVGSGKLDGDGIPPDFFKDIHVRRAFNYSFNWEKLIQGTYLGKALQQRGPIPEGIFGFDPEIPTYHYDLEMAEKEFRKAWGGEVWKKGFKVYIVYNEGNGLRKQQAELLQQAVKEINPRFKILIEGLDLPVYTDLMDRGRLPLYTSGWLIDYPDPHNFVYPILSSKGNWGHAQRYHNPEVEELIEKAARVQDREERRKLYRRIQQIAYEDPSNIYTVQPIGLAALRKEVQNWTYDLSTGGPQAMTYFYPLVKEAGKVGTVGK